MSRKNQRNYYRLLHVQFDAPVEVIKASYRTIMQKLKQHPDLGGDEVNASFLNEAYAVLTNPEKRAKYDEVYLKENPPTKARGFTPNQPRQHNSSFKKTTASNASGAKNYDFTGQGQCPFCYSKIPTRGLHGAKMTACQICDSPLTPVKKSKHTGNCKRALKRTAVKGNVRFLTAWPQYKSEVGKILNLSPMGLKFAYNKPIPVSSFIKVDSHGLKAVGRIVSCLPAIEGNNKVFNHGVEFITLSYRNKQGVFVSTKA